jgi:23S rRNA (pseudouridine1915-N3)-methyltransferase
LRILIAAVGRIGPREPERVLIDDYRDRATRTGRPLGLGQVDEAEVEDRRGGGPAAEGALLARAIPAGARLVALDERGKALTSPAFAAALARWRDDGAGAAAFVIGGADGLDPALRDRADLVLSFGPMVWPHRLARVMLAEQIYRAATILAGGPYHRA